MKILLTIIYLPISLVIAIACFLFVLLFESDFKKRDGVSAFRRIERESKNLALIEAWKEIPDVARAIIAVAIYYVLFL